MWFFLAALSERTKSHSKTSGTAGLGQKRGVRPAPRCQESCTYCEGATLSRRFTLRSRLRDARIRLSESARSASNERTLLCDARGRSYIVRHDGEILYARQLLHKTISCDRCLCSFSATAPRSLSVDEYRTACGLSSPTIMLIAVVLSGSVGS